jgi:hypothetical protein
MEINNIFLNDNFASYKNFEFKPILTKIILGWVQLFFKCQISPKIKIFKNTNLEKKLHYDKKGCFPTSLET